MKHYFISISMTESKTMITQIITHWSYHRIWQIQLCISSYTYRLDRPTIAPDTCQPALFCIRRLIHADPSLCMSYPTLRGFNILGNKTVLGKDKACGKVCVIFHSNYLQWGNQESTLNHVKFKLINRMCASCIVSGFKIQLVLQRGSGYFLGDWSLF